MCSSGGAPMTSKAGKIVTIATTWTEGQATTCTRPIRVTRCGLAARRTLVSSNRRSTYTDGAESTGEALSPSCSVRTSRLSCYAHALSDDQQVAVDLSTLTDFRLSGRLFSQ